MALIDVEATRDLSREEAAAWLSYLADSLARHNRLEFTREGRRSTVAVSDEVRMGVEIEIREDGSTLEIELTW